MLRNNKLLQGGVIKVIYLKLDGHDFQYEIEDILRLFFKDDKVILIDNDNCDEQAGVVIYSTIRSFKKLEDKERLSFELVTSLKDSGNILHSLVYDVTEIMTELKENDNNDARKVLKGVIKRQTYKVLSQYSGVKMPWGVLTGIRPAKKVHEMLDRKLNRAEIIDELTNNYYVSESKASLVYDVALAENEILESSNADMVSIYIGIPFCPTRCLYCSFTSNPIKKYEKMVGSYIEALSKEIRSVAKLLSERNLKIQSLYIGGGTPTAIDVQHLGALLKEIEDTFCMDYVKEYTLEAGRPDSITVEKLETIAKSRVDRISINPQTMKDDTLARIGRSHTSDDIIKAFKLARKLGFNNINMDVIAGLPGETLEDFLYTLNEIKKLDPESITVHTMSIKRASRLNTEKSSYTLSEGAEVAKMVDSAYEFIKEMGLKPYYLYRQKNILGNLENIGYAKPNAESIYNVQIMEERQTILALGAGATTKVVYPKENRIERVFNVKSVEEYISRIDEMIQRKENMRF